MIYYRGPRESDNVVTITPNPDASWRDEVSMAFEAGIAIRPRKGAKAPWPVARWETVAKHLDTALTHPAFRADVLAALERTASEPASEGSADVR